MVEELEKLKQEYLTVVAEAMNKTSSLLVN